MTAVSMVKPEKEKVKKEEAKKTIEVKSKVNMHLPGGKFLVTNEACILSNEEHECLVNTFGEGVKHLWE